MQTMCTVFAYFGPETVMPVTSIIATVGAMVVLFGKTLFRFAFAWFRTAGSRLRRGKATPAPPLAVRRAGVTGPGRRLQLTHPKRIRERRPRRRLSPGGPMP